MRLQRSVARAPGATVLLGTGGRRRLRRLLSSTTALALDARPHLAWREELAQVRGSATLARLRRRRARRSRPRLTPDAPSDGVPRARDDVPPARCAATVARPVPRRRRARGRPARRRRLRRDARRPRRGRARRSRRARGRRALPAAPRARARRAAARSSVGAAGSRSAARAASSSGCRASTPRSSTRSATRSPRSTAGRVVYANPVATELARDPDLRRHPRPDG